MSQGSGTDGGGGRQQPDHYFALQGGSRLHEFEILKVLGHGGFGITYLAHDNLLDEQVVIKEYFPAELAARAADTTVRPKSVNDQDDYQAGLSSFLEEARLLARLRHANIMRVRRFFEMHNTGYLVAFFEDGETLDQRLRREGTIPEPELLEILHGLLDGLDVVHSNAILHRDLKPSNIMLRKDGPPLLLDFGAARDFRLRSSRSVTAIATRGYTPPEQYGAGGRQGPWTDIYALGAILYRCVTARVPVDALGRMRKDPIVLAVKAGAGRYSVSFLEIIDWMLRLNEAERPGSVQELRDAISNLPTERTESDVASFVVHSDEFGIYLAFTDHPPSADLTVSLRLAPPGKYLVPSFGDTATYSETPQYIVLKRDTEGERIVFRIDEEIAHQILPGVEISLFSRDGRKVGLGVLPSKEASRLASEKSRRYSSLLIFGLAIITVFAASYIALAFPSVSYLWVCNKLGFLCEAQLAVVNKAETCFKIKPCEASLCSAQYYKEFPNGRFVSEIDAFKKAADAQCATNAKKAFENAEACAKRVLDADQPCQVESCFAEYAARFPQGQFSERLEQRISEARSQCKQQTKERTAFEQANACAKRTLDDNQPCQVESCFADYTDRYPHGQYRERVAKRIAAARSRCTQKAAERTAFEKADACAKRALDGNQPCQVQSCFAEYADRFPQGQFSEHLEQRISEARSQCTQQASERTAFDQAQVCAKRVLIANQPCQVESCYSDYTSRYPQGQYRERVAERVQEGRSQCAEQRKERTAFEQATACAKGVLEANQPCKVESCYSDYTSRYPQGQYHERVAERVQEGRSQCAEQSKERTAFEQATACAKRVLDANQPCQVESCYSDYTSRYPQGQYRERVAERVQEGRSQCAEQSKERTAFEQATACAKGVLETNQPCKVESCYSDYTSRYPQGQYRERVAERVQEGRSQCAEQRKERTAFEQATACAKGVLEANQPCKVESCYSDYTSRYPQGQYHERVAERVQEGRSQCAEQSKERTAFEQATACAKRVLDANQPCQVESCYSDYTSRYPQGQYRERVAERVHGGRSQCAEQRKERTAFEQATACAKGVLETNQPCQVESCYSDYTSRYPKGQYHERVAERVQEGRSRCAEQSKERTAFEQATACAKRVLDANQPCKVESCYSDYTSRYPQGQYRERVAERVQEGRSQCAEQTNERTAFEAAQTCAKRALDRNEPCQVESCFAEYTDRYPQVQYRERIKQRIAEARPQCELKTKKAAFAEAKACALQAPCEAKRCFSDYLLNYANSTDQARVDASVKSAELNCHSSRLSRSKANLCSKRTVYHGAETYCLEPTTLLHSTEEQSAAVLFDGDRRTAWLGAGNWVRSRKWLRVEFENIRQIEGFQIFNGLLSDPTNPHGQMLYSSVRSITAHFSDGSFFSFPIAGDLETQTIRLSRPVESKWIQFSLSLSEKDKDALRPVISEFYVLSEAVN